MDTIRRYINKKISKDLEDKYSVTEEFVRQGSTASNESGNSETNERRRIRSLSISRSGRYKQKRRERGALQDRPDLYQSPSNQETANDTATGESTQDNQAAACRQTTTVGQVPARSEGTALRTSKSKCDSASESHTGDGLRGSATATYKQTTASSSNNNNSISKNVRAGCKGAESGRRLTTQTALV